MRVTPTDGMDSQRVTYTVCRHNGPHGPHGPQRALAREIAGTSVGWGWLIAGGRGITERGKREIAVKLTVALVALGLAGAACQKNADPTTVAYWADQLPRKPARSDALKELGKLGKPEAVPVILPFLAQEGPWQADAALALGQLGDANVVPQLVAQIDPKADGSPDKAEKLRLNMNIVRALTALHARAAGPALLKLLDNPEPKTRELTIRALADLNVREATDPILKLLASEKLAVLAQAELEALGALGGKDPQVANAIIPRLFDDALYDSARFALLQLGDVATQPLRDTLERRNPVVEALRTAANLPLPDGFIEARTGATLGTSRAADAEGAVADVYEKLLKRLAAKGAASLKPAAVELTYALGNLGGATAVKILLPQLKATDADLRLAATEALTTAGPNPATVTAMFGAIGSAPAEVRAATIAALTRIAPASDRQQIEDLPKKLDDKITQAPLLEALIKQEKPRLDAAEACKEDVACWVQKLHDTDPVVRERAAYELGWLKAADAKGALMKALEDETAEVRMGAVLSLHRLGGADPVALQRIYETWSNKVEFAAVNQEVKWLLARSKVAPSA